MEQPIKKLEGKERKEIEQMRKRLMEIRETVELEHWDDMHLLEAYQYLGKSLGEFD